MPRICPFAHWRPLETAQREPRMRSHDIVCLHTMAGYLTSTDGMFRSGGWDGTESHFGVGGKWGPDLGGHLDGVIFQWQDLLYQADANLDGNPRVISIETADNAVGEIEPWTPAQVNTIVRLVDWLCSKEAHDECPPTWLCHQIGIPRVLVADSCPGRRGIAYHRLGIPPSSPGRTDRPWLQPGCEAWSSKGGKVCPSDARIAQTRTIVVPRVAARQLEDDMPLNAADLANVEKTVENTVRRVLNEGTGRGQSSWAGTSAATLATSQAAINLLNAIRGAVGNLDVDEAELATALAPLLVSQTRALSDADLEAIATAVNDEQHRRSAG